MDWFKFYHAVVHDAKVQKLAPALFKHWVNVLCLASEAEPRGRVPLPGDVAYALHITESRAVLLLDELLALKLLDADEEGNLTPHKWAERQYGDGRSFDPEERSESGSEGNHIRWHVKGGKRSQRCRYCIADANRLATVANREERRGEKEEEEEEKRAEETSRAPLGFVPQREPFFKDDDLPGFASEWVIHFRNRTGRDHPGPAVVADAMALEREFGREACMLAAADTLWEKGPSWLRPRLDEQRKRSLVGAAPAAARPKDPRYD